MGYTAIAHWCCCGAQPLGKAREKQASEQITIIILKKKLNITLITFCKTQKDYIKTIPKLILDKHSL